MSLPTIKTKCEQCQVEYIKDRAQYRYSIKIGRKQFCSMKCSTIHRDKKLGKEGWKKIHQYLIKEDSVFLQILRAVKNKCQQRHKEFDVDVQYLKQLWDSQKGICPYTKIKMILPESGKDYSKQYSLEKASLDRINSSKGYIKGNVEFVCLAINYAKNNRPQDEMKLFIEKVISYGQKTIPVGSEQLSPISPTTNG